MPGEGSLARPPRAARLHGAGRGAGGHLALGQPGGGGSCAARPQGCRGEEGAALLRGGRPGGVGSETRWKTGWLAAMTH